VLEPIRIHCRGSETIALNVPRLREAEHDSSEAQPRRFYCARPGAHVWRDLGPGVIERLIDDVQFVRRKRSAADQLARLHDSPPSNTVKLELYPLGCQQASGVKGNQARAVAFFWCAPGQCSRSAVPQGSACRGNVPSFRDVLSGAPPAQVGARSPILPVDTHSLQGAESDNQRCD